MPGACSILGQMNEHRRVRHVPSDMAALASSIGLFAGIGGFEVGFARAGIKAVMLCENDSAAMTVLSAKFPQVRLEGDIHDLEVLPRAGLLAAGFPCADLSQAGRVEGIAGRQSGLVEQVFRLLQTADPGMHVILENVPFMLSLDRGRGMTLIVERLEELGFRWAYRVVDTRSFGLPQRRRRVFLVASQVLDPENVLLADDRGSRTDLHQGRMAGFYWTEGNRGLGWTEEGVPPLKSGSGIGLATPPAVWNRGHGGVRPDFFTPDVRDAEALQGFPRGWTAAVRSQGARWRLVGNAVSVPQPNGSEGGFKVPGAIGQLANPHFSEVPSGRLPRAEVAANDLLSQSLSGRCGESITPSARSYARTVVLSRNALPLVFSAARLVVPSGSRTASSNLLSATLARNDRKPH